MSDIFTKRKRSEIMSHIRGSGNNDTELAMIKLFRHHRITGWRRNQPVFGKPDFVFRTHHVAVFVDGCFWHACPKHIKMPENNRTFWMKKLTANRTRDRFVKHTLLKRGWVVIRIWEHDLKSFPERCILRIRRVIVSSDDIKKVKPAA